MTRDLARIICAVALFAVVATTASAQPAAPAVQAATDEWTIIVAPYLMAAGMSGTVGVKGYDSTVDMSASDVLSHLKAGFMGYFGAKKNGWGFGVDLLPAVQVRVAKHAWLAFGYRYIYDDYKDDAGFVYKVTVQGPAFGFVFPF